MKKNTLSFDISESKAEELKLSHNSVVRFSNFEYNVDDTVTPTKKTNYITNTFDRMHYSSLFVFHIDGWLRRKCLLLAESPDVLDEFEELQAQRKLDQQSKRSSGEFSEESSE